MTATTTLTIWCDHNGPQACGAWEDAPDGAGINEAREVLRQRGWRYERGSSAVDRPSRDLCARHAQEPTR